MDSLIVLHLSPASVAVPLLHTGDWSQPKISPQRNPCKPWQKLESKNVDMHSVHLLKLWVTARTQNGRCYVTLGVVAYTDLTMVCCCSRTVCHSKTWPQLHHIKWNINKACWWNHINSTLHTHKKSVDWIDAAHCRHNRHISASMSSIHASSLVAYYAAHCRHINDIQQNQQAAYTLRNTVGK